MTETTRANIRTNWNFPENEVSTHYHQKTGQQKGTSENGIGNFRGFPVFDFGPYTEIENSENLEIPKFLK